MIATVSHETENAGRTRCAAKSQSQPFPRTAKGAVRAGETHFPNLVSVPPADEQESKLRICVGHIAYGTTSNMKTPFRKFDFNRVLNYPRGLGGEGPHKVTFYGCDPYEDRALYEMLIDLSRITGSAKYREEAEKSLVWWSTNTQGGR